MPTKTPSKKSPKLTDEADPRFEPVIRVLARHPGFSLMQSKSRGLRGLMLNGKSFGMSQHGRFILKLDDQRVSALIAEGAGRPFKHGPGRPMKGWVEVTAPSGRWVKLAKEACSLAQTASAGRRSLKRTPS
jgi:hypothetical protein